MDERDYHETIETPREHETKQNEILENVNATYEKMLKDVRKMIKDNNEAVNSKEE